MDAAEPEQPGRDPDRGTGGLRDPFILRKQDGTFVVLATDLKGTDWSLQSQYIHVWDSADLRSFTGYRRLKLHDMATHSWALRRTGTRDAASTGSSTRPSTPRATTSSW